MFGWKRSAATFNRAWTRLCLSKKLYQKGCRNCKEKEKMLIEWSVITGGRSLKLNPLEY